MCGVSSEIIMRSVLTNNLTKVMSPEVYLMELRGHFTRSVG